MSHDASPGREVVPPPMPVPVPVPVQGERAQHRIGLYLKVWGYLFVLSAMSYLVDYFHVQGILRWTLIVTFMLLKAGLIVSIFMHMAWERLALAYAIILPPVAILVFVAIMVFESEYTAAIRVIFFQGDG